MNNEMSILNIIEIKNTVWSTLHSSYKKSLLSVKVTDVDLKMKWSH